MGGEITAPAHTHSGEDGNVAAVDETLTDQLADQTEVSINTALGRMRYALINLRKMIKERGIILS